MRPSRHPTTPSDTTWGPFSARPRRGTGPPARVTTDDARRAPDPPLPAAEGGLVIPNYEKSPVWPLYVPHDRVATIGRRPRDPLRPAEGPAGSAGGKQRHERALERCMCQGRGSRAAPPLAFFSRGPASPPR